MIRLFKMLVGFLTYLLFGVMLVAYLFGPALLGYDRSIYSDAAHQGALILIGLWILFFPFVLLLGYVIQVPKEFLFGADHEEINLK